MKKTEEDCVCMCSTDPDSDEALKDRLVAAPPDGPGADALVCFK